MSLAVEVEGFNQLVADVNEAGPNSERLMKAALVNSVNKIQSEARAHAPHKTGTLQRSILTQVDYPEGQVQVNEKYGIWLEEGTGIYGPTGSRITPKKAKALAWGSGGSMVFARSTKGMKARPFFKPGIEKSVEYINAQFQKVIERLASGLAGKGF